jgi:hypothetical protein
MLVDFDDRGHSALRPEARSVLTVAQLPDVPATGQAGRSDTSGHRGGRHGRPFSRRTWISRAILLAILAVQAVLSLRLHNTAFEDEATYLYAGHLELAALLHGQPLPTEFTGYFSGSPVLYPVLAAVVDTAFGLAGVRMLSLVLLLTTTALLYSLSRRLFHERSALCAAALFATTQSTLFLGHFATYDATAIFLLAVAAWIVVRTAHRSAVPACVLAALVLALGVAVKYATLMYVPVVVLLAALTAFAHGRRRALIVRVMLLGTWTVAAILGALALGGMDYLDAFSTTTAARAMGQSDQLALAVDCLKWGGGLLALALFGTTSYAWRERLGELPGSAAGDDHGRTWRLALGLLLCGTALLAPIYQMHLHTSQSLHKHIGYGLLFAAPMAGLGLTRIMGAHFRFLQVSIVSWVALLTLGVNQSQGLYHSWPDSTSMIATVRQQLTPGGRYLVENDSVPQYYLRDETRSEQWISTYYIDYVSSRGQRLYGEPGYQAALNDGYFDMIVLAGGPTKDLDKALSRQLRTSDNYRMLGKIPYRTASHTGYYEIWVKSPPV